MGNLKSGLFHASTRFWLRSTMVTWMCGHLSAMTAQVGPPKANLSAAMRFPGYIHTDVACTDCGVVSERVAGKGHVDGNSLQQIFLTATLVAETAWFLKRSVMDSMAVGYYLSIKV